MGVRFAPSPTGTFHIGNLRTAWVSFQWAKALKLNWVVRFEDIDEPRNAPGAREKQLADMQALGLKAEQIVTQSQNYQRHLSVFRRAISEGLVYPCFCSRKEVREAVDGMASAPHAEPPVYNGRCRELKKVPPTVLPTIAWRFRGADPHGAQDFVVARTSPRILLNDGCPVPDETTYAPAYNWACAIDDFDGRYDLLVRAVDLAHVITQQRAIHQMLERWEGAHPVPAVFHCSLVVQNDLQRLEKRTKGTTLDELFAAGETPESILRKFSATFSADPRLFSPSAISGEPRPTMTLSDLGF